MTKNIIIGALAALATFLVLALLQARSDLKVKAVKLSAAQTETQDTFRVYEACLASDVTSRGAK